MTAELPRTWKGARDSQDAFLKLKLYDFLIQTNRLLVFPEFLRPTVSLVVPLTQPAHLTFQCLESILAFTTVPYELILIAANRDDEETAGLLSRIRQAKIVAPERPPGFIEGAEQGAALASGDFVFF